MKRPALNLIRLIFVTLFLTICLTVAFWPSNRLTLRCPDGSVLTISSITFGTNHTWIKGRWPIIHSPERWDSPEPFMAVWGIWNGRGQQRHSFKFVTMATGGYVTSTLTNRMQNFGAGEHAGLLASTTNSPGIVVHLRVFEEIDGKTSGPFAQLVLTNERLFKERCGTTKRWALSSIDFRNWRFGSRLIIANEDPPSGIVLAKIHYVGPLTISHDFYSRLRRTQRP